MQKIVVLLIAFAFVLNGYAQHAQGDSGKIFAKGSKITNNNFTGTAYLQMLVLPDSLNPTSVGSVTFEPGARTNWHYHPGGQILLVTNGKGWYQERGKPIEVIQKGDAIKCPPNIEHWHGATPEHSMTHVAVGTNTNRGAVVWLKPVSAREYQK